MNLSKTIENTFSDEGVLAEKLPGYTRRACQVNMALDIGKIIGTSSQLVCEAQTGTGKTFAYLVPALLSDQKVIVSTGTKNLQDQLYHHDIPTILKVLDRPVSTALLKGRSNYLCLYHLNENEKHGEFASRLALNDFRKIKKWSSGTTSGDIAQVPGVAQDSPAWQYTTSTNDNCLGADCPNLNDCYLVKARRKAIDAELVVINHHLLVADISLKETGFGELLPQADLVVIDEAHQLPATATTILSESFTTRQLTLLCSDIKKEVASHPELSDAVKVLKALELEQTESLNAFEGYNSKGALIDFGRFEQLAQHLGQIDEYLKVLVEGLAQFDAVSLEVGLFIKRADNLKSAIAKILNPSATDEVIWYEVFPKSYAIHITPTQIAKAFNGYIQGLSASWVFTSATIAINNDFSHFNTALGLPDMVTHCYPSPFDFKQQALLYCPRGLSDPSVQGYTESLIQSVMPIVELLNGRTFFLFTSFRALNQAVDYLRDNSTFELLVQGQVAKAEMIKTFKAKQNCVLLGTYSFWEGVDVRGKALSCVVIDKLPFTSPDDPVLKAKVAKLKQQGKDAFGAIQIPEAIISLKQGVGRLIRDVTDEGILVIGDPRLYAKAYGYQFISSLPDMTRTRSREITLAYAKEIT